MINSHICTYSSEVIKMFNYVPLQFKLYKVRVMWLIVKSKFIDVLWIIYDTKQHTTKPYLKLFLNQARANHRPVCAGFLKLFLCRYLYVSLAPRLLITSVIMWCQKVVWYRPRMIGSLQLLYGNCSPYA